MNTVTIPQKLAEKGDLVVIPKKEYEEFLKLRKIVPLAKPNRAEIIALARGRRQIKREQYVTWRNLKNELADLRRRAGKKTD